MSCVIMHLNVWILNAGAQGDCISDVSNVGWRNLHDCVLGKLDRFVIPQRLNHVVKMLCYEGLFDGKVIE